MVASEAGEALRPPPPASHPAAPAASSLFRAATVVTALGSGCLRFSFWQEESGHAAAEHDKAAPRCWPGSACSRPLRRFGISLHVQQRISSSKAGCKGASKWQLLGIETACSPKLSLVFAHVLNSASLRLTIARFRFIFYMMANDTLWLLRTHAGCAGK